MPYYYNMKKKNYLLLTALMIKIEYQAIVERQIKIIGTIYW